MKKIFKIVAIAVIILILGILTLFYSRINKISLIENIRQKIAQTEEIQNASEITTIDVTDLEDNGNLEHEHIFKTMYNENEHWEECRICEQKINKAGHTYETKYLGIQGLCGKANGWVNTCHCGYSINEYKQCVWSGQYNCGGYYHYKRCTNGHLETGVQCHLKNGTLLNCTTGGKCSECGITWDTGMHAVIEKNRSLICLLCGKNFGTTDVEVIRNRARLRYIYYKIKDEFY